jgi:hypothetical protein
VSLFCGRHVPNSNIQEIILYTSSLYESTLRVRDESADLL